MKARISTILRLSFQSQKLGCWAFQCVFILLPVLFSVSPITRIAGQEIQDNNTTGFSNTVSFNQRSTIQTVPLWGGSISYINSNSAPKSKTIKLHHFEIPCEDCHGTDKLTSPGKMQGEYILQKKIDINRTCTSLYCHDYNKVLNHPVNVSVNDSISEGMPLDDLRITCLTCHDEPKSSSLTDDIARTRERRLRIPNEVNLCGSCHRKMPGNLKRQSHWQFSSRAHLGQINLQSGLGGKAARVIGGIDTESRACISCHQDISVTVPTENESVSQKRTHWQSMKDHPIGMEYSRVAMRKPSKYRYPLIHNDRIRLFDGKVGCGSCHSLYSTEKNLLIQSNFRSALCFECHDI